MMHPVTIYWALIAHTSLLTSLDSVGPTTVGRFASETQCLARAADLPPSVYYWTCAIGVTTLAPLVHVPEGM